jgi:hypothetical protein
MSNTRFHATLAAALVALSSAAMAESVGRTEIDLSAQPWSTLATFQNALKFDGGAHTIPLSTKVFYIAGASNEPLALLVISSTDGGTGTNVRWVSETCPSARKNFYADDFESDKQGRTRQCLVVNSSFAPYTFYKADSEVLAAAETKGLVLFRSGYSIRSVYGAAGGSLLRVNLMTKRNFVGLPGGAGASNQNEVPEALVAWGQALHKAVQSSVMSVSGKLELPPMSFSP